MRPDAQLCSLQAQHHKSTVNDASVLQKTAASSSPASPAKPDDIPTSAIKSTPFTPSTATHEGSASMPPSEASRQSDDSSKAAWYGAILELQQFLGVLAGPTHQLPKIFTESHQPVQLSEQAKQQSEGWCNTIQKAADALQAIDLNLAVALYDQVSPAIRSCPALSQSAEVTDYSFFLLILGSQCYVKDTARFCTDRPAYGFDMLLCCRHLTWSSKCLSSPGACTGSTWAGPSCGRTAASLSWPCLTG